MYIICTAGKLLEAMDQNVEPCKDFFQFACGGWIEKNRIPDGRGSISSFGVLSEQIYYFVKGGFKLQLIKKLKSKLNQNALRFFQGKQHYRGR